MQSALACLMGLVIWAVLPAAGQIELVKHLPLDEFPGNPSEALDIWGFTDGNGREYAIVTLNNGVAVVDITLPETPVVVGTIAGSNRTWRDVKTYIYDSSPEQFRAYAFVTEDVTGGAGNGIKIIDLSDVPNSIRDAGSYIGSMTDAHNIFIAPDTTEPYAYVLGSDFGVGGVIVLDISNPESPVEVGCWDGFYTHDFYTGTHWADPNFDGQTMGIAFCGVNNVSILNLSDKANPTLVQNYVYPGLRYCHSGWMSEDGRYLFVCDESDERLSTDPMRVYILDLIDMSQPVWVTSFVSGFRAIDHNAFIKGDFLHLSNYTRGYTLLNIADPLAPFEVANYDTSPNFDDDFPQFAGAWGAFPYYQSDIVAISDIEEGLYLLQPNFVPDFCAANDPDGNGVLEVEEFRAQLPQWPNPNNVLFFLQLAGCLTTPTK